MRIVAEADQRAALDAILQGFGVEPVAVLDPEWSPELRRCAVDAVGAAADAGTLRSDSLVFFTSGSSGRPRAVHRSAGSWSVSADVVTALFGASAHTPVHLPGPMHSTLFLFGAWHARLLGAEVSLWDEDPTRAVVVHAVPAMLGALMARRDAGGLPSLETVVVAGDRLSSATADAVRSRGLRLVEYYGAAELSIVAAREDAGPLRPVEGVETRIVDGILWSRSAYQAYGYLDPDEDGPFRRGTDGWATVGDLARPVGGGFEIAGRGSAAVTVGGHTIVVEDVEAFMRGVDGVDDVAVLGMPHRRLGQTLVAAVVGDATEQELRSALIALPRASRPRRLVHLQALPRAASGKLLRDVLVEQLRGEPPADRRPVSGSGGDLAESRTAPDRSSHHRQET